MITIEQKVDAKRRGVRGAPWSAWAWVDGNLYLKSSRSGAPFALARVLVAAGIPDQPVCVSHEGLAGQMTYRSLHWMARMTIAESATIPVHARKWVEYGNVPSKNGDEGELADTDTQDA